VHQELRNATKQLSEAPAYFTMLDALIDMAHCNIYACMYQMEIDK